MTLWGFVITHLVLFVCGWCFGRGLRNVFGRERDDDPGTF
jgi:hypothetical protein